MHLQRTVRMHLDVPVEQAWEVFSDGKRVPEWHTQVLGVRDEHDTPDHIGYTAVYRQSVPGGEHDFQVECIGWEELKYTTFVGHEVGGGQTWKSNIHLTPAGNGVDAEWELDTEIPGNRLVGALAGKLLEQGVDRWMHKSLQNLEDLAKKTPQPA